MVLFRRTAILMISLVMIKAGYSQNIGIGTTSPQAKLQVDGSLLVKSTDLSNNAIPTAAQTHTMVNGSTFTFPQTDSVGRIYDPGGPAGYYFPNTSATVRIPMLRSQDYYIELKIESISLGTGDSLIISTIVYGSETVVYQVGNGFTGSNIIVQVNEFPVILFKSNVDASRGPGFSISFKRIYTNTLDNPSGVQGSSLSFYPGKGALRSGRVGGGEIGKYSTAFGDRSKASGLNSFSVGMDAVASGENSIAIGASNISSDLNSVAIGDESWATAPAAVAIGSGNHASGVGGFAAGYSTEANADYSTVLGRSNRAEGAFSTAIGAHNIARTQGSFYMGIFADTVVTEIANSLLPTNRVFVIGDGNIAARSSCFYILRNGNAWMQGTLTQASDARLKKNIVPLDGVLPKLLSLSGYNYLWKDSENMPGLQAGFIAQEVQQQMPELVTTNTEGQLAVNYSGMVPYLLEGIKEQQTRIDEQQQQIHSLSSRLEKLEKLLAAGTPDPMQP